MVTPPSGTDLSGARCVLGVVLGGAAAADAKPTHDPEVPSIERRHPSTHTWCLKKEGRAGMGGRVHFGPTACNEHLPAAFTNLPAPFRAAWTTGDSVVMLVVVSAPFVIGAAPAPPVNLPPWQPGMAPPVPGPVFSDAFNALIVLLGGFLLVLAAPIG